MNPPTVLHATHFAEVLYRTDDVLVVSVASDLAEDSALTGALMDVIATADACAKAESAIARLASALNLDVRSGHSRRERHVTIAARPATAAQPAPSVLP